MAGFRISPKFGALPGEDGTWSSPAPDVVDEPGYGSTGDSTVVDMVGLDIFEARGGSVAAEAVWGSRQDIWERTTLSREFPWLCGHALLRLERSKGGRLFRHMMLS